MGAADQNRRNPQAVSVLGQLHVELVGGQETTIDHPGRASDERGAV